MQINWTGWFDSWHCEPFSRTSVFRCIRRDSRITFPRGSLLSNCFGDSTFISAFIIGFSKNLIHFILHSTVLVFQRSSRLLELLYSLLIRTKLKFDLYKVLLEHTRFVYEIYFCKKEIFFSVCKTLLHLMQVRLCILWLKN